MSAPEDQTAPPVVTAPRSVLFSCNLNSIRSPMAEGLARRHLGAGVRVASCGVYPGGYLDPFMVTVMGEIGVVMDEHEPRTFDAVAEPFDVVVALTALSRDRAEELAPARGWRVEYWPSPDPSSGESVNREARLQAYRDVRDRLHQLVCDHFMTIGPAGSTNRV